MGNGKEKEGKRGKATHRQQEPNGSREERVIEYEKKTADSACHSSSRSATFNSFVSSLHRLVSFFFYYFIIFLLLCCVVYLLFFFFVSSDSFRGCTAAVAVVSTCAASAVPVLLLLLLFAIE